MTVIRVTDSPVITQLVPLSRQGGRSKAKPESRISGSGSLSAAGRYRIRGTASLGEAGAESESLSLKAAPQPKSGRSVLSVHRDRQTAASSKLALTPQSQTPGRRGMYSGPDKLTPLWFTLSRETLQYSKVETHLPNCKAKIQRRKA